MVVTSRETMEDDPRVITKQGGVADTDSFVKEDHRHLPDCSLPVALALHAAPVSALVAGLWVLPSLLGLNLVDHTLSTLQIALALEVFVILLTFTVVSITQNICQSVVAAIWRGLISLPTGACIATFGAIIFGAPLAFEYSLKTFYWAHLLSALSVFPAGIFLGSSWSSWQRLFAFTKPRGGLEYAICVPAHGAVVGAWFGAWPMPLDWERPWQEWPVSVTYGMAGGFIIGSVLSFALFLWSRGKSGEKQD